jgi:hypothetical protein
MVGFASVILIENKCSVCDAKENLTIHHVWGRHNNRVLQLVCWECHRLHNKNFGVYGWITKEELGFPIIPEKSCTHSIVIDIEKKLTVQEVCIWCGTVVAIRY